MTVRNTTLILISILLLSVCNKADAQVNITDSATLRAAINTDILPNNERLITAAKMNRILNGILNVMNTRLAIPINNRVFVATTEALPASTYDNGSSGVGATLTANAGGAFPEIDGITMLQLSNILIKDQADTLQNGIYQLTIVGNDTTNFVLTRTTGADQTAEINNQLVAVSGGIDNAGNIYQQTVFNAVIGTDKIKYKIYT